MDGHWHPGTSHFIPVSVTSIRRRVTQQAGAGVPVRHAGGPTVTGIPTRTRSPLWGRAPADSDSESDSGAGGLDSGSDSESDSGAGPLAAGAQATGSHAAGQCRRP